jgi:hypothetical protein
MTRLMCGIHSEVPHVHGVVIEFGRLRYGTSCNYLPHSIYGSPPLHKLVSDSKTLFRKEKAMRINRWFLSFAFAGMTLSAAFAQDTAPKSKAEVRSITGCLSKGDSANEYLLTGSDGSTWEVHSNTAVNLADHVGHTVTLKGVVANAKAHNLKEDAKTAATDTGVKKADNEHGHLKVTNLKMVSESCK